VAGSRHLAIVLVVLSLCACGSSSTAPQVYPDLSGTWSGNLTVSITLTGAPTFGIVCLHQWTISSSAGGQITGTWQSSPDLSLANPTSACQQSGSLTGTISPSGAISVSFNTVILGATCSSVAGNDAVSGSLFLQMVTASGQDAIRCPTISNEPRTLTLSVSKLQ